MPGDEDAPPGEEEPPAPRDDTPVGFWSELCANVRKELKPPITGFFVATPNAPVQGALVGDRLELRCGNDFTAQMLDRPDVLEVVSRKAGVMLGKAFDCRLGCGCVADTLRELCGEELGVDLVGVLSSQEEMGTRGAQVAVIIL